MGVLVYETDVGIYLNNNAKLKDKFKREDLMFGIELDGISKLTGTNTLLASRVQAKCWPIVQKHAVALIKKLEKNDKEADDAKREKGSANAIDKFGDALYADAVTEACKVFDTFAKDKSKYKRYKVKSGLKIAVDASIMVGAVVIMATTAVTVAGAAVGAIGVVRSVASIAQQIINLHKDADVIYKRVSANIAKLRTQLNSPSMKATKTAKQVATTVAHKVFAVEIETVFVTVKAVEGDLSLLLNKVRGCKMNQVSMAKALPSLADQQLMLERHIAKLVKEMNKRPKDALANLIAKSEAAYEKLVEKTGSLIQSVEDLEEKIVRLDKWTVNAQAEVKQLKTQYNPSVVAVASVATTFVLAASSVAGGSWGDPATTLKELGEVATVANTATLMTIDLLNNVKDLGMAIRDEVA